MGPAAVRAAVAAALTAAAIDAASAQRAVLRTSWGHPDLEGVWNFATMTPLQRPPRFEGRAFMTYEESLAVTRDQQAALEEARRRPEPDGLTLDEFWYERGPLASVDGRWPTSLIVDPPDGRLQLHEFACHEGNYCLPNMLRGARAGERASAKREVTTGK